MLTTLKDWIINICTAVFFITAVEMILPDNNLKKYAKFVLGIILITVFLNPIIKIFNSNLDLAAYSNNFSKELSSKYQGKSLEEYKNKKIEETLKVFEENMNLSFQNKLKEKFPESSFQVNTKASYNEKAGSYEIMAVKIGRKEGGIEKIKKIQIKETAKQTDSTKESIVKNYICNELRLSSDIVEVYEL